QSPIVVVELPAPLLIPGVELQFTRLRVSERVSDRKHAASVEQEGADDLCRIEMRRDTRLVCLTQLDQLTQRGGDLCVEGRLQVVGSNGGRHSSCVSPVACTEFPPDRGAPQPVARFARPGGPAVRPPTSTAFGLLSCGSARRSSAIGRLLEDKT